MAGRHTRNDESNRVAELVKDLIIVQLGLAGVGQREIRSVVGGDINRINRIVKHLRKPEPRGSRGHKKSH
jgi:hypothetical protein